MKITRQAKREATELYRFCQVNGVLEEGRGQRVIRQLIAAKPRGYLGILTHFRRLVKLDHARHTARIDSAAPLPEDQQAKVLAGLAQAHGPGLNTCFSHNPALIGGMRIQVGSDVYDGSVRARLAALEQSL
jgi:F-type H+-transporting ATPase subunit delta